jgi:protein involved in polysaccharide export with SLBB domain
MTWRRSLRWIPLVSLLVFRSLSGQSAAISRGDVLEINVYGHEDLSTNVEVKADGTVDYPLISGVPIDGLRLDEFRQMLSLQITKTFNESPIVTVRFSRSITVSVAVLGQVVLPGEYQVLKTGTLQGAVARAGGPTARAQLDSVRVIRETGGVRTVIPVNLLRFTLRGDPELLPDLMDGDVISVPAITGASDVKVIGEVRNQGSYPSIQGASVLDVLLQAGGPTRDAALNRVRLVSPRFGRKHGIKVNLESVLAGGRGGPGPVVLPGDIVVVPNRQTIWRRGFSLLRDVVAIASPVALILYYSGAVRR